MRRFFSSVLEIVEIALITLVVVLGVRGLVAQPFLVSGASMEENFKNGDYLLVDELTYRFRMPERGEVAVFRFPRDESVYFIKRVIALPGERVVIHEGEIMIYNDQHPEGFVLKESYLPADVVTSGSVDMKLKDGEYFFLGDNRPYSFDSRSWGVVKKEEIVGVARLRLYPINKVTAFEAPNY